MQRQGLESGRTGSKGSVSSGEEVEAVHPGGERGGPQSHWRARIVDGAEGPCLTSSQSLRVAFLL